MRRGLALTTLKAGRPRLPPPLGSPASREPWDLRADLAALLAAGGSIRAAHRLALRRAAESPGWSGRAYAKSLETFQRFVHAVTEGELAAMEGWVTEKHRGM